MKGWPWTPPKLLQFSLGHNRAQHAASAGFLASQDTTAALSGTMVRSRRPWPREGFRWSEEADTAFSALKGALCSASVLQLPDFAATFVVDCDVSGFGFGAVLHQEGRPIAFFSRPFAARHLKTAAYERELIGLV